MIVYTATDKISIESFLVTILKLEKNYSTFSISFKDLTYLSVSHYISHCMIHYAYRSCYVEIDFFSSFVYFSTNRTYVPTVIQKLIEKLFLKQLLPVVPVPYYFDTKK